MKKVSFVEFRKHLSEYIGMARFAHEWTAVTQHGKVVGGFVSKDALEMLMKLQEQEENAAYDRGMKSAQENGTISHEELKKRLGL
jgi:PHD/YefM family antitoxin component YafN of YafNO toxin-antitoxin module